MTAGLRDFLVNLEDLGELHRVKAEVDPELELCHIAKLNEMGNDRALLFENVRGRRGRVLTSLFSMGRFAAAMDMPLASGQRAICERWMKSVGKTIPPVKVGSGPVLEETYSGDDVNLELLAIPHWYPKDGGMYLTYPCVVLRHPERDWTNVGIYRIMVNDKKRFGIQFLPGKHGRQIIDAWHATGEPAPIAVMLGCHPMLLAYAGSAVASLDECEYDHLGGLLGEPFDVLDAPVTGLPVEAGAEMVIEGYVPPGVLEEEGPFGEFPGYYTPSSPKEVIDVEAVHHRRDFIIWGTTAGKPVSDNHVFSLVVNTAAAWRPLRDAGVPGLNAVACPQGCGGLFVTVVSLKPQRPGHAMEVGRMVRSKIVIVVDEDIDPFNMEEVLWAVNYRYQPDRGTMLSYEPRHTPLDPSVEKERKMTTSKLIIDATRPLDWEDGFPREVEMDDGVIEKVRNRWHEFFGEDLDN